MFIFGQQHVIRIAQNTRVLCILEARSSSLVFNSQNTENLEKFLDFLCKELHRREIAYQNTVHNGLQYDYRAEYILSIYLYYTS